MTTNDMEYKGIPKLKGITFPAWKKAITMALRSENCLRIVEQQEGIPECPEPLDEGATRPQKTEHERIMATYKVELQSYEARIGKAGWMIYQSLTPESETYVKDTVDPIKMWKVLHNRMDTKGNKVLQRSIKRDFHDLKLQHKEPIEDYIRKLRDFQTALEGTTEAINDSAIVSQILVTLPSSWDTKVSAIEDNDDITLDELEKILKNYQRKIANREARDIALATKGHITAGNQGRKREEKTKEVDRIINGRVTKDMECWYCLQKGHYQISCPLRIEKERRRKERESLKANLASETPGQDKQEEERNFMAIGY